MERQRLCDLGLDDAAADEVMGEFEALGASYEEKLSAQRREAKITELIGASGARNIKAVRALIEPDGDDVEKSVSEEIARLKKDRDTRFLFAPEKSFEAGYSSEKLPDTKADALAERLRAAREKGDTVAAIRIKQEAAREKIFLI